MGQHLQMYTCQKWKVKPDIDDPGTLFQWCLCSPPLFPSFGLHLPVFKKKCKLQPP